MHQITTQRLQFVYVSNHTSGGDVTFISKVVHNSGNDTFYQSQGDLRSSAINNEWTDSNFSGNALLTQSGMVQGLQI